jgi:hypothetical protein
MGICSLKLTFSPPTWLSSLPLSYLRGGVLKQSRARETEGVVFYEFEFENPLDLTMPRVGAKSNP